MVTQGKRKSACTKNPMFTKGTHDPEATSSTPIHVEIPYILPRRQGAPLVQVTKKQRFIIPWPNIPTEVTIDGNMLSQISEFCYVEHDFHNFEKFSDFTPKYYTQLVLTEENKPLELQFQQWALGLEGSGITNFLDVPHFGRGAQINQCVKILLSYVHDGYLWLDRKVSIDTQLIHKITTIEGIRSHVVVFW